MWVTFIISLWAVSATVFSEIEQFPTEDSETSLLYFRAWAAKNGKHYGSQQEIDKRYSIFLKNMKKAAMLNSGRESSHSAVFGPSKFSDLTQKEFERTVLGSFTPAAGEKLTQRNKMSVPETVSVPSSFDWRDQRGVVTPVRDQGKYPTGWAFAGAANIESLYAIRTGDRSKIISVEAFIDCDGYSDEYVTACGVRGADMPAFYLWLQSQGGVMSERDYPYCAGTRGCRPCAPPDYNVDVCGPWPIHPCLKKDSCNAKYNRSEFVPGIHISSFIWVPQDELLMRNALMALGPLVASLDAIDMQLYMGGILQPLSCDPSHLNHAVLIAGYGETNQTSEDFWRAKNSWGTGWGEAGFFRIQRNVGACGINSQLLSARLEK